MPRPTAKIHRPLGFTIIEMIVALLVVAAGIIGVAALYADRVHANADAELHARAVKLAEEIAARITANTAGRIGYVGTVGVICDKSAKPKLEQDAAAIEGSCWQDEVETELPSGLGSITRDTTTNPIAYVVAVSWSAPESGTASYVLRVVPPKES
ncbi:MAG TPA: type IV pilus modification protein PilV [Steroidobacteraceae bacterium]|nr:type IV pilus modification protein PilV [Steroidobacteraceae bacterium]